MAGRTQKRLWPAVCLIPEQVKRCPVMVFSAFGAANLAYEWKQKGVKLFYFDVRVFNGFTFCESRDSFSAVKAIKRIFRVPTRINVVTYAPSISTTMFAWVFWIFDFIFPRGISHETMPILRQ
jgi:hypothetical protein